MECKCKEGQSLARGASTSESGSMVVCCCDLILTLGSLPPSSLYKLKKEMISDNILSLSRSFMYKIKVQKDFVSNLFFSE